jgi:predicted nucleotidyltransferase
VECAVVGGIAVSFRSVERTTKDLDLAVAVTDDSEAEFIIANLASSGYRIGLVLESDVGGRLATVRLISEGEMEIFIDLLFASSGIEREVVDRADPIELFPELTVKVATRPALIALKVLSADIRTRPQDVIDLGNLIKAATHDEISEAYELVQLITARKYNRDKNLREDLDRYIGDALNRR